MRHKIHLILGLLLFVLFSLNMACEKVYDENLSNIKDEINFCSLVNLPEEYESKIIKTKAYILGFHKFIFYSDQCLEQNKVIALEMNYESRHKLVDAISANKINYKTDFLNNNLYAEITVSGELKENDDEEEPEVFHPKYKFFANKIEKVNIPSEEIFPVGKTKENKTTK